MPFPKAGSALRRGATLLSMSVGINPGVAAGAAGRRPCRRREVVQLSLCGLSRPLEFVDCPELAAGFAAILRGWNLAVLSGADGPQPLVGFRWTKRGYRWRSASLPAPAEWRKHPPRTAVEAICDIHYHLIDWLLQANPNYLYVHCAAVEIGGGLVAMPSPTRAGKSTLSLHCAAAGHRVFCDDVLPIEPERNDGVAIGILPRVRLPLPPSAGARLHGLLAERGGPSDSRYAYVDLGERELAPFGARAPIRSLVLLERKENGPAALMPVRQGEMLKLIIRRNFAYAVPARHVFERFQGLTAGAERFRLTYCDGREAVALLERRLA